MRNSTSGKVGFRTLCAGVFRAEQVDIDWDPSPEALPSTLNERIEAFWSEHVRQTVKRTFVYDGTLSKLRDWQALSSTLRLKLIPTDYKTLVFANAYEEEIIRLAGEAFLPRALGVSAVVLTGDQRLLLIERSREVGEYPGKWDVVGGHLEPEGHGRAGAPDPFLAITTELCEEINLRQTVLKSLVCLGLIESLPARKPELIFLAEISQPAETMLDSRPPILPKEIERVFTVSAEPKILRSFVQNNRSKFTPSAQGALALFTEETA